MKKFSTCILLFFILTSQGFADCFYQEIDPVCSISGQTYTSSCDGWSDTSSWTMPVAYNATCQNTPELSEAQTDRVYDILVKYYQKKDYLGSVYGTYTSGFDSPPEIVVDDTANTLNPRGQDFVNNKLFPAIKKRINSELEKSSPDMRIVALLNYISSTVGYDYYLTK